MAATERLDVDVTTAAGPDSALVVRDLSGGFHTPDGNFEPVLHDVGFTVQRGKLTALVGETGSGKSITALSILGLTPPSFETTSGSIDFEGRDLLQLDERSRGELRGSSIAMVFQSSRTALNPVFSIGTQLGDVYRLHHGMSKKGAKAAAEEGLARVHITSPGRRLRQYPHELSGGTVQRVQIAMALACEPTLLLLDEPTTGLDATIQADILDLIVELNESLGTSACMITHDMGVVAATCDHVVVMRTGEVREAGAVRQVMTEPADDYTRDLLAASRIGSKR